MDHLHGLKGVNVAHVRRGAVHDPVVVGHEEGVKSVGAGAVSATARLSVGPRHLQPDEYIAVVVVVQDKTAGIGAMRNHFCVYFFFTREKGGGGKQIVGLDVLKEYRNKRLCGQEKKRRKLSEKSNEGWR